MSYPSVYAWQDELSAVEFQAALDAAKQDAERVRTEFVESLPAGSPAYDAEWTTRYGSKDRLIFVFSVVLDLDADNFDIRDYPGEAADSATADLRRRLVGTKVDEWSVFVVTVTGRPRPPADDRSRWSPQARGAARGHRKRLPDGYGSQARHRRCLGSSRDLVRCST